MGLQTKNTFIEMRNPTYVTSRSNKQKPNDDGLELLCEAVIKQAVNDWQTYFQNSDAQYAIDSSFSDGLNRRELIKFFNSELFEDYLQPFPSLSARMIRKAIGVPTVELFEFEKEEMRVGNGRRKKSPFSWARGVETLCDPNKGTD